jgi:hypothetical protein
MLQISCARCGRIFSADVEHIGKSLRCSGCGNEVPIQGSERQQGTASTVRAARGPVAVHRKRTSSTASQSRTAVYKKAAGLLFGLIAAAILCLVSYQIGHKTVPAYGPPAKRISTGDPTRNGSQSQGEGSSTLTELSQQAPDAHDTVADQLRRAGRSETSNSVTDFDGSGSRKSRRSKAKIIELDPSEVEEIETPFHPARSLPTGTQLSRELSTNGHGLLQAVNSRAKDAYVIVVDAVTRIPLRRVYIRAGDEALVDRLSEGRYEVYFVAGVDWDSQKKCFSRDKEFFRFGSQLDYSERTDDSHLWYSRYRISLNPIIHGNVRAVHLSEEEFRAATHTET